MTRQVELPFTPSYFTAKNRIGVSGIIANAKRTGANWFINHCVQWALTESDSKTAPISLGIPQSIHWNFPFVSGAPFQSHLIKNCFHTVIKRCLNTGHYLYYWGADDHLISNKKQYGIPHYNNDGMISGYDGDTSYTIVAYNQQNDFDRFKVSQESLFDSIYSENADEDSQIHAFKIDNHKDISIDVNLIKSKVIEYLNPCEDPDGIRRGMAVYDRLDRLINLDPVYRFEVAKLIFEHKKCMLERIKIYEDMLCMENYLSDRYTGVVEDSNELLSNILSDALNEYYVNHLINNMKNLELEILTELTCI